MPFYYFHQNNSGGSFTHDASRGISVDVIIEAKSLTDANNRARSIGIYFNGCSTGQDCNCCGDRWGELYGDGNPSDQPEIYGKAVAPGQNFPSKDEGESWMHKWMDEGTPEGYIHYLNGKVEPFHQTTNPRTELAGQHGYGVSFNKHYIDKFAVDARGWAEDGNSSAPWAKYQGSGKKPKNKMIKIDQKRQYGEAWFPTEQEADDFVALYNTDVQKIKSVVGQALQDADITAQGKKYFLQLFSTD